MNHVDRNFPTHKFKYQYRKYQYTETYMYILRYVHKFRPFYLRLFINKYIKFRCLTFASQILFKRQTYRTCLVNVINRNQTRLTNIISRYNK